MLIFSDGAIAVAIFILSLLYIMGSVEIWHIYGLMFIRALLGAFQWPSFQASTSLMVPKEQLSRVAGFNQTLQGLVNIIAPPLGALLFDVLPIQLILAIDIATAIFAIGPLFFISIPQPLRATDDIMGLRSVLVDMRKGMRFIWDWKGLRLIMGMSMAITCGAGSPYRRSTARVQRRQETEPVTRSCVIATHPALQPSAPQTMAIVTLLPMIPPR